MQPLNEWQEDYRGGVGWVGVASRGGFNFDGGDGGWGWGCPGILQDLGLDITVPVQTKDTAV